MSELSTASEEVIAVAAKTSQNFTGGSKMAFHPPPHVVRLTRYNFVVLTEELSHLFCCTAEALY